MVLQDHASRVSTELVNLGRYDCRLTRRCYLATKAEPLSSSIGRFSSATVAIVGLHLNRIWVASDTQRHMSAGKHPCGPFRCDGVTEVQVEDLDAPKGAARRDSASPAGAGVRVTGNCLRQ